MISFNTKITFSKTILVSTILMISVFACSKTEPEKSTAPTAAIIVENMASGFNLGNTYDNGHQKHLLARLVIQKLTLEDSFRSK